MPEFHSILEKMTVSLQDEVQYSLKTIDGSLPLNQAIGSKIRIEPGDHYVCAGCGKHGSESVGDGYCKKCSFRLACCDRCITNPALCHWHEGTCREPDWGEAHCRIPHTIYLSNSSGLKVGITREHQRVTRWIDQGAIAAIPVLRVPERLVAGRFEQKLMELFPDKTNWRAMLSGDPATVDLVAEKARALAYLGPAARAWADPLNESTTIRYPVHEYPQKVKSLKLSPGSAPLEGILCGIKGQYLLLDIGVWNVRSHSGLAIRILLG